MEVTQPGDHMVFIGIDIGTTHCKVGVYTKEGVLAAENKFRTPAKKFQNGWAQYDMEELWNCLEECIIVTTGSLAEEAAVIGVSSQGESCVLTDENFTPLTMGIPWYDSRTDEYTDWWRDRIEPEQIYKITGLELSSIYTIMKLQWWKEHEKEAYEKAYCFHCMSDYIAGRMTGKHGISYSMASRTMALDLRAGKWSTEILKTAGIRASIFPNLLMPGQNLGTLTEGLAKKWKFNKGCSVSIAGFDHMAGCVGAGAENKNQVIASIGTTESVCLIEPNLDAMGDSYFGYLWGYHVYENQYYLIGGIPAGGQTIDWAIKTLLGKELTDSSYEEFETLCQSTPVLSNGVLFLPHLNGCCAPIMDNHSRAAFYGVSKDTLRGDMARAVMEGLCMEFRLILESSKKKDIEELIAIGGGIKNESWMQCKADVLGIPVRIKEGADAVTLGAAVIAAKNICKEGTFNITDNSGGSDKCYIPDKKNHEKYEKVYQQIYKKLYFIQKEVNDKMRLLVKEGGDSNGDC